MLCQCGYKLSPGEQCEDCRDRAPREDLAVPGVVRPRLGSGYNGPPPTPENLEWLLQFEAAVLSKVVASLVSRSNTLHVSGFLVEADPEKHVARMAVVKVVLNGKERAVRVVLDVGDDRVEIARKITEALRQHLLEVISFDMPFEWHEGGFRKMT